MENYWNRKKVQKIVEETNETKKLVLYKDVQNWQTLSENDRGNKKDTGYPNHEWMKGIVTGVMSIKRIIGEYFNIF